jgi:hypothetical protein
MKSNRDYQETSPVIYLGSGYFDDLNVLNLGRARKH